MRLCITGRLGGAAARQLQRLTIPFESDVRLHLVVGGLTMLRRQHKRAIEARLGLIRMPQIDQRDTSIDPQLRTLVPILHELVNGL